MASFMAVSMPGWSTWQTLQDPWTLTPAVFQEVLNGGQAFRWNRQEDEAWVGIWGNHVVRLKLDATGHLHWQCRGNPAQMAPALCHYLALDTDFDRLADALPWRCDPIIQACRSAFPGLRLLRQPPGETLLAFLCSSTKRIPQIKQACETLALELGEPLGDGFHALPDWERLAAVPEARLRACGIGYRARYVAQTAAFLHQNTGWLEDTTALPFSKARERLLALPGVGEKIADCVLLFGYGRLEAFPVDTWILKAMRNLYDLGDLDAVRTTRFGQAHFGHVAGLAQQYLFAGIRSGVLTNA